MNVEQVMHLSKLFRYLSTYLVIISLAASKQTNTEIQFFPV